MRNLRELTVGMLTMIALAACASFPELEGAGVVPEATTRPAAVTASIHSQENVALNKTVGVSTGKESALKANDGDLNTFWNSLRFPPQWLSVSLGDLYMVDRIELAISQAPAGPTTHEIWLGNGSGVRTLYKRLADVDTEDSQILQVAIEPPQSVDEVLILSLGGPSWVGWREIRVFGSLFAYPLTLQKVAAGLELPVKVTHAGDGSGRLFVVEQQGRIH